MHMSHQYVNLDEVVLRICRRELRPRVSPIGLDVSLPMATPGMWLLPSLSAAAPTATQAPSSALGPSASAPPPTFFAITSWRQLPSRQ